jgi:hypothetical protein
MFGMETGLYRGLRHWRDIHARLGTHLTALGLRSDINYGIRRILDYSDVGAYRQWRIPAYFDDECDTVVRIKGRSVRGNV